MTLPKFKPKVPRRTLEEIKRQGRWSLGSKLSYLTYSFRYGIYNFLPPSWRWLMPLIQEDIKDLFSSELELEKAAEEFPLAVESEAEVTKEFPAVYEKYRCPVQNPFNCPEPQRVITENPSIKSCSKCGFPALLPQLAEIQGKRGRYRIERFLNNQGLGRIYSAMQLIEDRPVIIKEYLLPKRYFNEQEGIKAQLTFESVCGLSLADGRLQNGRIVEVIDAIADREDRERCYLIAENNAGSTLRTYLAQKGAMTPRQVRHFLNLTLQSLEYLHGQKFRLPKGQIEVGLAHGNLNLDTVLISSEEQLYFHKPRFLVYLWDLALWESLFAPPSAARFIPTTAQDLKALGLIGFYLLAGSDRDRTSNFYDPKFNQDWGKTDIALKLFLFRLLELDTPFASAKEARRALLNLPEEEENSQFVLNQQKAIENKPKKYWWWLLLLVALGLLASLATWWLSKRQMMVAKSNINSTIPICCISSVTAVPTGIFTFTAEQNGIWNYVFRQPNLIQKNKTLQTELLERRPQLQLNYQPQQTGEEAIAQVRAEKFDFAIGSLTSDLSQDLKAQTFAYDGLTFFVAFSHQQRANSLPKHLNGRITFKQIQQLYTGQISNWQQLGGPDLPVRLYIPMSNEAIRIFEQRVLRDEDAINQFRKLMQSQSQSNSFIAEENQPKIVQIPTIPTLSKILRDFEIEEVGSIGFGTISQVFGQCSVYPLALNDSANNFVQPLVQDTGEPINPSIELCNKKGAYHLDYQTFQSNRYPLAYPIAVIFRWDNRWEAKGDRFAEILKTQEAQQLLTKTGIVPLPSDR